MKTSRSNSLKLYIFHCSNSTDSNEFDLLAGEEEGTEYKIISLPCSGKATVLYFLKAFETGADGLIIVTCSKNSCRYLEGNLRTPRRAEKIDLLLEEAGLGRGRITVLQRNGDGSDSDAMISQIKAFRDQIRSIPLSISALEEQPMPSISQSLPASGNLRP